MHLSMALQFQFSAQTGDLFVIIEYCRYGNLLSYIIKNRHKFVNQVDSFGFLLPLNKNGECEKEESHSDTENELHFKKYFLIINFYCANDLLT